MLSCSIFSCSLPELRQGEGFTFFNFLSSIVCTDVQHPYLGKAYVICVVMALVPDDSLVPFLEEYLRISYLAAPTNPHCLP